MDVSGYTYDAVGNLSTLTYPGGKTVTYGYDTNDRMVKVTDWSGRVTKMGYDLSGRPTSIQEMNIFGAINVGVFIFAAVAAGRLADTLLPHLQTEKRGGLILLLALLSGFAARKLYLILLNRLAEINTSKHCKKTELSHRSKNDIESESEKSSRIHVEPKDLP